MEVEWRHVRAYTICSQFLAEDSSLKWLANPGYPTITTSPHPVSRTSTWRTVKTMETGKEKHWEELSGQWEATLKEFNNGRINTRCAHFCYNLQAHGILIRMYVSTLLTTKEHKSLLLTPLDCILTAFINKKIIW